MIFQLFLYYALTAFQSALFVHSATNSSDKALGIFQAFHECANARYHEADFKNFTSSSLIKCAVDCMKSDDCLSFSFRFIQLKTNDDNTKSGKHCLLHSSAAESCDQLSEDTSWRYMRLTHFNGKGSRMIPSSSTDPEKNEDCNYRLNCTGNQQFSFWEMMYEVDGNNEIDQKGKHCFIQAVLKGASVRVTVMSDGDYRRLAPVAYSYNQSDETEIDFQFAPRYLMTTNGHGGYDLGKVYLGISTKGMSSEYYYNQSNLLTFSENLSTLRAKFFIRYTNCNESYKTTGAGEVVPYSSVDMNTAFRDGVVITSSSEERIKTLAVPAKWMVLDPFMETMGRVRIGNGVFSDTNPLAVTQPLVIRDEVFSTDGDVNIMDLTFTSMDEQFISTSKEVGVGLEWFVDHCWEIGLNILPNSAEDPVYNTEYLKRAIRSGRRLRVQYERLGMHHMKSVYCVYCNVHNCIAALPYHPGLKFDMENENYHWISSDSLPDPKYMHFVHIVKSTMIYYNADATVVDSASRAMWYVDSSSYREVFVVSGTAVTKDRLENITDEGVNLQIVFFQTEDNYISFEVEELVGMDTAKAMEMHSPLIPDVSASHCGQELYMAYKFILYINPFAFKKVAWHLNMDAVCFPLRDETFMNISVFASA